MVLDGIARGMDVPGNRNQSKSAELSASHDNRPDVQKTGSVGSMIINPLLYDLTCETTGGLRFVHDHNLAVDSPSCGSRCGCNGAELEFADMEAENRLVVECREFEAEWLTWVVCWQEVATAVLMSQSFRRVNWLTWVVCWQEVATAVLMSQGFQKVKWLTWVVCWQGVVTAVLMSHGFVVEVWK